jgi:hypothetical protein
MDDRDTIQLIKRKNFSVTRLSSAVIMGRSYSLCRNCLYFIFFLSVTKSTYERRTRVLQGESYSAEGVKMDHVRAAHRNPDASFPTTGRHECHAHSAPAYIWL